MIDRNGKHIFFDLDGTLTDPAVGITRCIQYALAQLGEPVPGTADLLWCIGPPLQGTFAKLLGKSRADEGVDLYRKRFADIGLYENLPYPGIHQTLEKLGQVAQLHVASSKPLVYVSQILDHFGLTDYFDNVFGSELDGTRTDKSELLAYALSESGVSGEYAVMVGDRKHDAIGAQQNNMAFVGVLYGYGSEAEFTQVGVQHLVEDHPELIDLHLWQ